MALPEKPLTRRETYLAKAAGQAVTLPETDLTREELYLRAIAEGGGGGGVTPEYVAEAIAEAKADIEEEIPTKTSDLTNDSGYAAIDDTTAAQNKTYSSAKVEEKVAGEEITVSATGSDLTLSTSSGNLNALTVYGKSEVVDGSIKSAGEGWATVDLGTLEWVIPTGQTNIFVANIINAKYAGEGKSYYALCSDYSCNITDSWNQISDKDFCIGYFIRQINIPAIAIKDTDYTDATAFKNSLNGVILAYQLADPTQSNAIAIKTDDGSGIDGTMATFSTGTPLQGIPDSDVRDVMAWDGSAGTVTKNCVKVRLADLTWIYDTNNSVFIGTLLSQPNRRGEIGISTKYNFVGEMSASDMPDKSLQLIKSQSQAWIKDTDYTTATDFTASLADAEIVYELATPTTQNLTSIENDSIAGLRTFTPQTHAQNNAGAEMTIEAYAGTENGQAVNELKQDVQSEISALKITQSGTLTLTTAGWSNNSQTVTYAHDTSKRNVIDVDPTSVEEWANCGVLATAETASGITFTCKTVPENALTFRVTSMGVN